jgi:hypothetical protein
MRRTILHAQNRRKLRKSGQFVQAVSINETNSATAKKMGKAFESEEFPGDWTTFYRESMSDLTTASQSSHATDTIILADASAAIFDPADSWKFVWPKASRQTVEACGPIDFAEGVTRLE